MEILISGASTGIGKACAVHLAGHGHSVWAGVRSQDDFDKMSRLNVRGLKPVFLDVSDENSVRECVSSLTKSAGTLHGLINNAGVAIGGPIEAVPVSEWQRQFDINVLGVIRLTQACLPRLRESKGRIVNMSSISGRIAPPFMAPYAASKFALEAFSDSLRRELVPQGIRVAIIEPGAISTPIWEKGRTQGVNSLAAYSDTIKDLYGARLEKFRARLEQITRDAAPVSLVTRAVDHALFARRPRTRYPVGRGIKTAALISSWLPAEWFDRAMR
jgi:NAD(P)-dependent dehydrogenase (short-subunit alcohol dehydrogenase family)